jgi:hypothetical protein
MATFVPQHVHFVGSIALDGPRQVFAAAGRILGRRLKRVPDGEPGARIGWVQFQWPLLRNHGAFAVDRDVDPRNHPVGISSLRLAEGVSPDEIHFGELGYAREARASYLDFTAAKRSGDLPAAAKFQVSLPTPRAIILAAFSPRDSATVLPIYEQAMFREVADLCASIPREELCLQWDVCIEMILWDRGPGWRRGVVESSEAEIRRAKDEIVASLGAACAAVPPDVDLGIQLCYGDLDGRHFVDPVNAANMVELANALTQAARPIAYIHMPVPLSATDEAFFQPLSALSLSPGTELFLGLIHQSDGATGARARIAMAAKFVTGFGVATECGFARTRTPEIVTRLLETHAAVTQEPPPTI